MKLQGREELTALPVYRMRRGRKRDGTRSSLLSHSSPPPVRVCADGETAAVSLRLSLSLSLFLQVPLELGSPCQRRPQVPPEFFDFALDLLKLPFPQRGAR